MGRWGLPVNIFAVVWGALMALNLAWPRADVYGDALVQHLGRVRLHRRRSSVRLAYWWFVKGRHHIGHPGITRRGDR